MAHTVSASIAEAPARITVEWRSGFSSPTAGLKDHPGGQVARELFKVVGQLPLSNLRRETYGHVRIVARRLRMILTFVGIARLKKGVSHRMEFSNERQLNLVLKMCLFSGGILSA